MNKLSKLLKNQQGYVLLIVLLIIVLFSVLGMSLMSVTSTSLKNSVDEKDNQAAFYIAENGVKLKMHEVKNKYERLLSQAEDYESFAKTYRCTNLSAEECILAVFEQSVALGSNETIEFEDQFSSPTKAIVTVVEEDSKGDGLHRYKVISTGMIGSEGERQDARTVDAQFSLELNAGEEGESISFPNNLAVFTKTITDLSNGTITGDIVMQSTAARSMQFKNNPTFTGTLYYPINATEPYFQTPGKWWDDANKLKHEKKEITFDPKLPEFPAFPTDYPMIANKKVTANGKSVDWIKDGIIDVQPNTAPNGTIVLTESVKLKEIRFNGNTALTIDVGNRDVSMVLDKISGNGQLDVKSTNGGKLTLYITDNIQSDVNNHINVSGGEDLQIYIGPSASGRKTLVRGGSYQTNASIYAFDANIDIGGSASVNGTIVTGGESIKMPGNTRGYAGGNVIFAPNARVDLLGSSELRGSVVAKSFYISGGAKVFAVDIDESELPFFKGGKRVKPVGSIRQELVIEN